MPGKIFINYRRDDAKDMAARVRDRLAQTFGDANVFMDVDNLLAGQRFDKELENALAQTDVFLAVIGPRWLELLAERQASGERDYVREEIAGALKRGVVVIPVLVEHTPLPSADPLTEDIRVLVLHQKHVVTHEQFGRDVAGLAEAIRFARKAKGRPASAAIYSPMGILAALALVTIVVLAVWVVPTLVAPGDAKHLSERAVKAKEAEAGRVATEKAEQEEAERQRLAMLKIQEERAEGEKKRAEAKRVADEEAARRDPALSVKAGSGESFRDCPDCPEMVVVPAGSFMMGSPASERGRNDSEGPQHKVTITKPFAVGKYEVTFAEWDACVAAGDCKYKPGDEGWGRGRRPVINVSMFDVTKQYLPWLSRKTGRTYRLLTEAEWEYGARGVTSASSLGNRYWWGDQASHAYANYGKDQCCAGHKEGKDQWEYTAPVGQFPVNPFGMYDMHGNVWEWVQDCDHWHYQGAPTDGSAWIASCWVFGMQRGGSWFHDLQQLRSASRGRALLDARSSSTGFRLARNLD